MDGDKPKNTSTRCAKKGCRRRVEVAMRGVACPGCSKVYCMRCMHVEDHPCNMDTYLAYKRAEADRMAALKHKFVSQGPSRAGGGAC